MTADGTVERGWTIALPSCRWLGSKARMDDACRVYNDQSDEWAALKDKPVPAVWQQASTSWQRAVAPLMALMGRDRYHAAGLQEIARFMRHVRGRGPSFPRKAVKLTTSKEY